MRMNSRSKRKRNRRCDACMQATVAMHPAWPKAEEGEGTRAPPCAAMRCSLQARTYKSRRAPGHGLSRRGVGEYGGGVHANKPLPTSFYYNFFIIIFFNLKRHWTIV